MWGEVQVGPVGAGVQARFEPHIRADEAFELAPESVGAPTAEGDVKGPARAATAVSATTSKHDV